MTRCIVVLAVLCLVGCGRRFPAYNFPSVCAGGVIYWRMPTGTDSQYVLAVGRDGRPLPCGDSPREVTP